MAGRRWKRGGGKLCISLMGGARGWLLTDSLSIWRTSRWDCASVQCGSKISKRLHTMMSSNYPPCMRRTKKRRKRRRMKKGCKTASSGCETGPRVLPSRSTSSLRQNTRSLSQSTRNHKTTSMTAMRNLVFSTMMSTWRSWKSQSQMSRSFSIQLQTRSKSKCLRLRMSQTRYHYRNPPKSLLSKKQLLQATGNQLGGLHGNAQGSTLLKTMMMMFTRRRLLHRTAPMR